MDIPWGGGGIHSPPLVELWENRPWVKGLVLSVDLKKIICFLFTVHDQNCFTFKTTKSNFQSLYNQIIYWESDRKVWNGQNIRQIDKYQKPGPKYEKIFQDFKNKRLIAQDKSNITFTFLSVILTTMKSLFANYTCAINDELLWHICIVLISSKLNSK